MKTYQDFIVFVTNDTYLASQYKRLKTNTINFIQDAIEKCPKQDEHSFNFWVMGAVGSRLKDGYFLKNQSGMKNYRIACELIVIFFNKG
jgi:hypothetical protein